MMRFGEFIISAKKENQFEDAVFTWNLSDRGISGLHYFGDYEVTKNNVVSIIRLYINVRAHFICSRYCREK